MLTVRTRKPASEFGQELRSVLFEHEVVVDSGRRYRNDLFVDPSGIVYDSTTGAGFPQTKSCWLATRTGGSKLLPASVLRRT